MARANARTCGLLNRWPIIMNESVWRFNQVTGPGVHTPAGSLAQSYIQYERDYIADSLQTAVAQVSEALGYPPAPTWVEDEHIMLDPDRHWSAQGLLTRFGRVIEFGRRATTLISAGAAVAYSDSNGDQVDDLATVTVTTSVDASEVRVFFRVADGAESAGNEFWEIDGLTRSSAGGVVTLTGHRALFAHPLNVWATEYTSDSFNVKHTGDTGDSGAFVFAVDVYRVYSDATDAVQLIGSYTDQAITLTDATANLIDKEYGVFNVYTGASQTLPEGYPDALKISYKAGLPLVNGRMEPRLETAIIRYANTIQAQQPALGDRVQAMWANDRALSDLLTRADANTPQPFGITNAGYHLSQVVRSMRLPLKARA